MKRRVAMDHPKCDLAAYSGADSDFWKVESPFTEETSIEGVVEETWPEAPD